MKWYHYILLALKLLFLIEFGVILYDKKAVNPKLYLITEILFKLLLSLYMTYLTLLVIGKEMELEDKIFISFGAGLLGYDAIFNDFPHLLELYGIHNTSFVR